MSGASSAAAWLALAGLMACYLVGAARQRRRGRGWSGARTLSFGVGVALLAVAAAPALVAWSHHDLRGHMVQHLLLGMLAPLALVLGAPLTLLLRSMGNPAARRLSRVLRAPLLRRLGHPATALALDTGGLYLLYLTPLYAATHSSALLRGAVHLHFLAAGYLFAAVVAGPDPMPHRPRFGVRLAMLFLATAAHATLAKLMYAYGWPRGTHHHPEQIRDAARLMYYGGDVAELLLAVALFAAWYRAGGRRLSRSAAPPAAPAPRPPVPRPAIPPG